LLELAQAMLKLPTLKAEHRGTFLAMEFNALATLKREREFFERYDGVYFGAHPTGNLEHARVVMYCVLNNLRQKGDFDGAAARIDRGGARLYACVRRTGEIYRRAASALDQRAE